MARRDKPPIDGGGMAVWALARLLPADRLREIAQSHLMDETGEVVRAEWDEELKGDSKDLQAEIAA